MHIGEDFVPRAATIHSAIRGEVLPPPSVVRRLQHFNPRLGLRWMTGAHVPYWALTETWADGDPRWEQVQTGRIPRSAAYGIAHMFPLTVTTEDMAAYVEQRYGDQHRVTGGEAAKEASRMVDEAQQSQRTTQTTNIERATQTSLDRHERESKHALRVRAGVERAHPMIEVP